MDNYEIYSVLGKGTYAVVYGGVRKTDGKHFALKVFNLNTPNNIVRNEVQVMRHLMAFKIDNIVEVEEIFMNDNKQYVLVMEKLGGGELFDRIIERGSFSENDAAICMKTFITALRKLHTEVGLIHRDLKPENIVYIDRTRDSDIKIVDFGLSVVCNPQLAANGVICKDMVGTIGYMAPESITRLCYSAESDIWSAGVILYCVLTGIPPFNSEDKHISHRIVNGEYYPMNTTYWDGVSETAKDLVRKMLTVDPNKRITTSGVLSHPWITQNTSIVSSSNNLGEQYVKRIAQLSSRQKFRKVVNGIIWANRLRKNHLTDILFPKKEEVSESEKIDGPINLVLAKSPSFSPNALTSSASISESDLKSTVNGVIKESDLNPSFTNDQLKLLRQKFVQVQRKSKQTTENRTTITIETNNGSRRSSKITRLDTENNNNNIGAGIISDGSDGIGYEAFCQICESVGLTVLAQPHVFRLFDNDGNGSVDYREFLMALTAFRDTGEDAFRLCFDVFDVDGSGEISLQELKTVMASLMSDSNLDALTMATLSSRKHSLSTDEGFRPPMKVTNDDSNLEALFHAIDTNGDGCLNYEEFRAWLGSDVNALHAMFIDPMTKALANSSGPIDDIVPHEAE